MSAKKLQLVHKDLHLSGLERNARSIDYVVDADKGIVIVTFRKKLTFQNIDLYTQLLRANPVFKATFSEIADISDVEEVDLQSDEFQKLADERDPFSLDSKRAFVARTSVQNHAARMHKILRGKRNIEIFSTLEAAQEWING